MVHDPSSTILTNAFSVHPGLDGTEFDGGGETEANGVNDHRIQSTDNAHEPIIDTSLGQGPRRPERHAGSGPGRANQPPASSVRSSFWHREAVRRVLRRAGGFRRPCLPPGQHRQDDPSPCRYLGGRRPDWRRAVVHDDDGWHRAKDLVIPENVTPVHFPPYCPELTPMKYAFGSLKSKPCGNREFPNVENVWAAMIGAWDRIAADACQGRSLTNQVPGPKPSVNIHRQGREIAAHGIGQDLVELV